MTAVDTLVGPLLVGSYVNSVLYMLEVFATIQYYSACKKHGRDSFLLQAVVYFTATADTVCTVSTYIIVYLDTVTHWGDIGYIRSQHRVGVVLVVTTGISATTVQSFLIYRYWRISYNKYITSVLIISMFTAFGGCVGTVVSILVYEAYTDRPKLLFIAIWSITSAALDVAIALVLLWQLSRIKSSLNATQSLIHRLMVYAIGTGAVTSVIVVAILIMFIVDNRNNWGIGIVFCVGRVYTLTMLFNLNNRTSLKQQSANANDAISRETGNTMNAIHVIRTETVQLESLGSESLRLSDRAKDDSDLFSAPGRVSMLPSET